LKRGFPQGGRHLPGLDGVEIWRRSTASAQAEASRCREFSDLPGEEVDQEADAGDSGTLRHDQQAEPNRRRLIIRQDGLEPAGCQKVVDKPAMRRCDAPPGDKRLPGAQPVIDAKLRPE
jgi:hypothetical protein